MKVWGHRGASGYAPENTLEAFEMCIDMKADGVELDVQLSKDGELVVIHDETIDRVSNGNGFVKDYTIKELKSFNYNKIHPEFERSSIPTLKEVYELLKSTDLEINVELKTSIIFYEGIEEKVLNLAKDMNMENRIIYSSFNHYSVKKIKELKSDARTGFLYTDGFIDVPEYTAKQGMNAIHPPFGNLKYTGFIEESKKNGLDINVWNVRDDDIRVCCKVGINAIITNYPDRSKEIIKEFYVGE